MRRSFKRFDIFLLLPILASVHAVCSSKNNLAFRENSELTKITHKTFPRKIIEFSSSLSGQCYLPEDKIQAHKCSPHLSYSYVKEENTTQPLENRCNKINNLLSRVNNHEGADIIAFDKYIPQTQYIMLHKDDTFHSLSTKNKIFQKNSVSIRQSTISNRKCQMKSSGNQKCDYNSVILTSKQIQNVNTRNSLNHIRIENSKNTSTKHGILVSRRLSKDNYGIRNTVSENKMKNNRKINMSNKNRNEYFQNNIINTKKSLNKSKLVDIRTSLNLNFIKNSEDLFKENKLTHTTDKLNIITDSRKTSSRNRIHTTKNIPRQPRNGILNTRNELSRYRFIMKRNAPSRDRNIDIRTKLNLNRITDTEQQRNRNRMIDAKRESNRNRIIDTRRESNRNRMIHTRRESNRDRMIHTRRESNRNRMINMKLESNRNKNIGKRNISNRNRIVEAKRNLNQNRIVETRNANENSMIEKRTVSNQNTISDARSTNGNRISDTRSVNRNRISDTRSVNRNRIFNTRNSNENRNIDIRSSNGNRIIDIRSATRSRIIDTRNSNENRIIGIRSSNRNRISDTRSVNRNRIIDTRKANRIIDTRNENRKQIIHNRSINRNRIINIRNENQRQIIDNRSAIRNKIIDTRNENRNRIIDTRNENKNRIINTLITENQRQIIETRSMLNQNRIIGTQSANRNRIIGAQSINKNRIINTQSTNRRQITETRSANRRQITETRSANRNRIIEIRSNVKQNRVIDPRSLNQDRITDTQYTKEALTRNEIKSSRNMLARDRIETTRKVLNKNLIENGRLSLHVNKMTDIRMNMRKGSNTDSRFMLKREKPTRQIENRNINQEQILYRNIDLRRTRNEYSILNKYSIRSGVVDVRQDINRNNRLRLDTYKTSYNNNDKKVQMRSTNQKTSITMNRLSLRNNHLITNDLKSRNLQKIQNQYYSARNKKALEMGIDWNKFQKFNGVIFDIRLKEVDSNKKNAYRFMNKHDMTRISKKRLHEQKNSRVTIRDTYQRARNFYQHIQSLNVLRSQSKSVFKNTFDHGRKKASAIKRLLNLKNKLLVSKEIFQRRSTLNSFNPEISFHSERYSNQKFPELVKTRKKRAFHGTGKINYFDRKKEITRSIRNGQQEFSRFNFNLRQNADKLNEKAELRSWSSLPISSSMNIALTLFFIFCEIQYFLKNSIDVKSARSGSIFDSVFQLFKVQRYQ